VATARGKYNLLVNRGVGAALRRFRPNAVLCGGYKLSGLLAGCVVGQIQQTPAVALVGKHRQRSPSRSPSSRVSESSVSSDGASLCRRGKSSRDYLIAMGAPRERSSLPRMPVDVEFYAAIARSARQDAARGSGAPWFAQRYFLCAGRLVPEKGIFDLARRVCKTGSRRTISDRLGVRRRRCVSSLNWRSVRCHQVGVRSRPRFCSPRGTGGIVCSRRGFGVSDAQRSLGARGQRSNGLRLADCRGRSSQDAFPI